MAYFDRVAGVILAGGQGKRIGRNKSFIELGGRRLIERVLAVHKKLFSEITIVAKDQEQHRYLGQKLVEDSVAARGSLVGIYTGLLHSRAERCFFSACDMPFLNEALIAHMVEISEGNDVLMARLAEGAEPLHAVYSKACLGPIEELMSRGDMKIINFFEKVRVTEITEEEVRKYDPQLLSFFNINSEADLKRAQDILESRSGRAGESDERGRGLIPLL